MTAQPDARAHKPRRGEWHLVAVDSFVGECARAIEASLETREWEQLRTGSYDAIFANRLAERCGFSASVVEDALDELCMVACLGWPQYVDGKQKEATRRTRAFAWKVVFAMLGGLFLAGRATH
jgi:hypothetical protein